MSFLSRLFRSGGQKNATLDLFRSIYGGRVSTSGVTVTHMRALEVATVLACVRVIANGIAQVSWPLYQQAGDKKRKATEHPVSRLLGRRPNTWQTAYEFRVMIAFHLVLTGNAFVWIGRVGRAREIRALEPIEPGRVTVKRNADQSLTYEVRADDGSTRTFSQQDIWHIRGPSWNGWMGMDATNLARDTIGLTIAIEKTQADFNNGGPKISGVLSMEGKIGQDRYDLLSKWLDEHAEGGKRAGKPIIVDGGAKFTPLAATSPVDAQHLELRKLQIEEVCRTFGVMPIMVGQSDKAATYASAEQMFLAHIIHTMSPWYSLLEQSADAALLTEAEIEAGYYTKFNANAMMRGAAKDRAEFYTKALGAGGHGTAWMVVDEVRDLEDLDPIEGGDVLPVGAQPKPEAPPAPDDTEKPDGSA